MPLCGPVSNKKDTEFLQYINSVFFCVSVFFFVSLQLLNCINQKNKRQWTISENTLPGTWE